MTDNSVGIPTGFLLVIILELYHVLTYCVGKQEMETTWKETVTAYFKALY
jgi:hypothetical protein